MTTTQSGHVTTRISAALIAIAFLASNNIGETSALQPQHQHPSPTFNAGFPKRPIRFPLLWSTSEAGDVTLPELARDKSSSYDWDDQFEQLQSFMKEYGHCNFPPNPPLPLQEKYPLLAKFCIDQRIDYQLYRKNENKKAPMGLNVFDQTIRCRRLEELGFEFSQYSERWYDRYHELLQWEQQHAQLTPTSNCVLYRWTMYQRGLKKNNKLPESRVKLLDDVGFEWRAKTPDEQWNKSYQELVAFRNEHGHLNMDYTSSLYKWAKGERHRFRGVKGRAPPTEEHKRLLDEIGFSWEAERHDARWHAMYGELQRFQEKYGHCRPEYSLHQALYNWSNRQKSKYRKGIISDEQINLLEKIGFAWERKKTEWPRMYGELDKFCKSHGHLRVNQKDDPELYEWTDTQRKLYHNTVKGRLNDGQIEKLEDLHFCWSLDWRDRTWHDMYTEAAEFFKEHGHVRVTNKENPSLYNWIQIQKKRYKQLKGQKPLSQEELEMLEQIDFPFLKGQPRMAWNARYSELQRYREENGGLFPTSHNDDRTLHRWMRQQRHRYRCAYGYAPLSADQTAMLERIDFPMYPSGKYQRMWYEKYDELVDFEKQHGHFLVDKIENPPLYWWTSRERERHHGKLYARAPITRFQVYLLERIGFPWVANRSELEWEEKYSKVVESLETLGHFPTTSENAVLAYWIFRQRRRHKGARDPALTEHQLKKLQKIGVVR